MIQCDVTASVRLSGRYRGVTVKVWTVKACSVGLQIPLEDFLRVCLRRTAWRCRFGVARVSVRQCNVTASVTLSGRYRGVTVRT